MGEMQSKESPVRLRQSSSLLLCVMLGAHLDRIEEGRLPEFTNWVEHDGCETVFISKRDDDQESVEGDAVDIQLSLPYRSDQTNITLGLIRRVLE